LTNLQGISLVETRVVGPGLAELVNATRLNRLDLCGTHVGDGAVKGIVGGKWAMTFLGLQPSRVSNKGYSDLKTAFPDAEIRWSEPNRTAAEAVLSAGGTVGVRAKGATEEKLVKTVRELPNEYFMLIRYRLAGTGKAPDDLPGKLAALSEPGFDGLEGADFSRYPLDIGRLKDFLPKTVTDLSLADTRVTDDDLRHLQAFPGLRRLSLDGCPVRGPGLAGLTPELKSGITDLSVARTPLSDAQAAYLKGFTRLRRLSLAGCPMRGPGLATLRGLTELRELDLGCPTLTDLFAEELAGLTQIERLSLAGSSLTDEGIRHLRGLTRLEDLDLTGTKVTAAAAAALQKDLPACRVRREPAAGR
jgi:hypothetical protein